MFIKDEKIIPWIIVFCGFGVIILTLSFSHIFILLKYPLNFALIILLSLLPYIGLALYAKNVITNVTLTLHQKNMNLSGIAGGMLFVSGFAIWSFSAPMDGAINPTGMFWIFSVVLAFIGFATGALVSVLLMKWKK